jgi:hypothetical protein
MVAAVWLKKFYLKSKVVKEKRNSRAERMGEAGKKEKRRL